MEETRSRIFGEFLYILNEWTAYWSWLKVRDDGIYSFTSLIFAYTEPHRFYHTLYHLVHGWDLIGEYLESKEVVNISNEEAAILRIAFGYHDIKYDTARSDNEVESAKVAVQDLMRANVRPAIYERVQEIIEDTAHKNPPRSPLAEILVDADLGILGATPERYDDYSRDIWLEYTHGNAITSDQFHAGRLQFLERFLTAHPPEKPIYNTEYFRNKFEEQARINITAEIAHLKKLVKKT